MGYAIDDLRRFLQEEIINTETDKAKAINTLYRCNAIILASELLKDIDKTEYTKTKVIILQQKMKNEIFLKEILKFLAEAERSNVELIFLKGIFLAADLYKPMEMRRFGDIDILIDINDLNKVLGILENCGYAFDDSCKKRTLLKYNGSLHSQIFKEHLEFYKEINATFGQAIIPVEIHAAPFNPAGIYCNDTQGIIERAYRESIWGATPWLLEIHDRIIYSMLHFFKHFFLYFDKIISGKEAYIDIQNLNDIALMVDKYKSIIDWDTIIQRSLKIGASYEIGFVGKLVNKIYDGRFPDNFLNKICSYSDSYFCHDAQGFIWLLPEVLNMDMGDIMFGDIYKAVVNVVNAGDSPKIICPYGNNAIPGVKNAPPYVKDALLDTLGNTFEMASKDIDSKDFRVYGNFSWDETHLNLYIRVYDDILVFDGEFLWKQDSIELQFIVCHDNKFICVRRLVIAPVLKEGKILLGVRDSNAKQDFVYSDNSIINHSINIYPDGYDMTLHLLWEYLNIKPEAGMEIPFYIAANDVDDNCEYVVKTRLQWSANSKNWADFRSFGQLCLSRVT